MLPAIPEEELGKKKPYGFWMKYQASQRFARGELLDALAGLAEADVAMKSGQDGRIRLERVLVGLLAADTGKEPPLSQRLLVTSALPYANGSIHLGHLVEYIQTDVYVRFRRAIGDDVTYVCAADSHGTPIEVNAAKAGMTPKAFVEKYRDEQHEDFKRFGVEFSTYYTTDSDENRKWAYRVYDALKAKGLIYKKSVEQLYCEMDRRFLPDRFVKGTCPKCGTPDQYGDVCESCGTTYDPRELKSPYCAICRTPPVVRSSDHAYVNLRKPEVFAVIERWVNAEGHLEPSVREQVRGWLADLQDWCITRDEPYFGFPVNDPEFAGKFLYVWVDAPIGYLSSAEHYFADEAPADGRLSPADFERRYLAERAGRRGSSTSSGRTSSASTRSSGRRCSGPPG